MKAKLRVHHSSPYSKFNGQIFNVINNTDRIYTLDIGGVETDFIVFEITIINELIEKEVTNLSGVFFAPNRKEMMPFVIEAIGSFEFSLDANATSIVSRIISNHWMSYNETCELAKPNNFNRQQGDFNLKSMIEITQMILDTIRLADFFKHPSYYGIGEFDKDKLGYCGIKQTFKPCVCSHEDLNIFAIAVGSEIIHTSDNDCYQTAGGYRSYESDDSPLVHLRADENGIQLVFESSLMIDHYNNNFAGVSTGNGTTKYKKGENIVSRTINTYMYDVSEVLTKYNLTLKKMDTNRGISIFSKFSNI